MQERMDMLEAVAERAARAASGGSGDGCDGARDRLPGSMSRKLACKAERMLPDGVQPLAVPLLGSQVIVAVSSSAHGGEGGAVTSSLRPAALCPEARLRQLRSRGVRARGWHWHHR